MQTKNESIRDFDYKIIRSLRSRSIRISISPNCEIKVIASHFIPEFFIHDFVSKKSDWITNKLVKFSKNPISKERLFLNGLKKKDFLDNKKRALELIINRLEYFNKHYGFEYKRISIRNQKSRWGSCSHNGNLSFNYKIVFLKSEIQDYVVVHELCHLKELNHGKSFWNLVGETIKDYKKVRGELKRL